MYTKEEVEKQIRDDYEACTGKVVHLHVVEGYDANGDNATVVCDPPVLARISPYPKGSEDQCIIRWMDNTNCDPVYDFEILEHHPAFDKAWVRPSWCYGTSRSIDGKALEANFTLASAELQEAHANTPEFDYSYLETMKKVEAAPAP
jgi:hypothetical protein